MTPAAIGLFGGVIASLSLVVLALCRTSAQQQYELPSMTPLEARRALLKAHAELMAKTQRTR